MDTQNIVDRVSGKKTPKLMRVFKSTLGTMFFVMQNGKSAHFVGGRYLTDVPSEIHELEEEIEKGHPHIYVDTKEVDIDVNADPLAKVKENAIKEYLAEQAKATERALTNKDMGTSDRSGGKGTGVSTSANVSAASADSTSGSNTGVSETGNARLAALKSK